MKGIVTKEEILKESDETMKNYNNNRKHGDAGKERLAGEIAHPEKCKGDIGPKGGQKWEGRYKTFYDRRAENLTPPDLVDVVKIAEECIDDGDAAPQVTAAAPPAGGTTGARGNNLKPASAPFVNPRQTANTKKVHKNTDKRKAGAVEEEEHAEGSKDAQRRVSRPPTLLAGPLSIIHWSAMKKNPARTKNSWSGCYCRRIPFFKG